MKHLAFATVCALALGLALSAQTMPGNTQPSTTDPSQTPNSTHPETSPSQTPDMGGSGNSIPNTDKKSEKSIKGCIESSGSQYTLTDKHGKQVILSGSPDFASHVGHTVNVHGTLSSGSDSPHRSSSGTSGPDSQFMVSKLDMVSERCNNKPKTKDSGDNTKPSPNFK